jgi:flagellar basal-body rod modification protein FlgD
MSVDPVGGTTTSAVPPATTQAATVAQKSKSSALVDYNQFLKLLMAELKYQDPTSPNDPTQYISQLSSFSALEQQVNTNSRLDALLTSNSISQANSLIGHTITTSDQSVSGKVTAVSITADGSTATLENGATVSLANGITVM